MPSLDLEFLVSLSIIERFHSFPQCYTRPRNSVVLQDEFCNASRAWFRSFGAVLLLLDFSSLEVDRSLVLFVYSTLVLSLDFGSRSSSCFLTLFTTSP